MIARLQAENAEPWGPGRQAGPGAGDPPAGGRVFRGRDDPAEAAPRFVEDHRDAYEVKRLRAGGGGALVPPAPGEPAHRPVSGARPPTRP